MIIYLGIGLLCFSFSYFLLHALPRRRSRWYNYDIAQLKRGAKENTSALLLRILWINLNKPYVHDYKQLLIGCGFRFHVSYYLILKRIIQIASVLMIGFALAASFFSLSSATLGPFLIAILLQSLCLLDRQLLSVYMRKRKRRVVREVYVLSKQLLFYRGSKMNLHSKLTKCLPVTTILRKDLELLLRDWYEGAEQAIYTFKMRIGTDEGFSFSETLNSLRLHESDLYYDLLRQRIVDYKQKMQLDKEGEKETKSYMLFILAGLPIMNTFRVFIYPWVQEGQKLFESLN